MTDTKRFYVILACWEPMEGYFPTVVEVGQTITQPHLFRSPMEFETREEAEKWGYDNDPDAGDGRFANWEELI